MITRREGPALRGHFSLPNPPEICDNKALLKKDEAGYPRREVIQKNRQPGAFRELVFHPSKNTKKRQQKAVCTSENPNAAEIPNFRSKIPRIRFNKFALREFS